jgi:prepilin-type N-terminal cleavage/methylation domain-containing protein
MSMWCVAHPCSAAYNDMREGGDILNETMGRDMKIRRGGPGGFTLVELLVVIAIVALLASFILPGLSRAREYAYFTTCKSSLRQMGIGLLIYASDNGGRLAEGYDRCTKITNPVSRRSIGVTERSETDHAGIGKSILAQIYNDTKPYQDWNGNTANLYMGRPRLPGKYLPIEVLWCPITSVRGWTYEQHLNITTVDTEKNRDLQSRYEGAFGYAMFITTVGCAQDTPSHTVATATTPYGTASVHAEQPNRPMTRSRQPHTSNPPSVWLAADMVPFDGRPVRKHVPGHFGSMKMWPDFRFNAVHMDGHVHDDTGKDFDMDFSGSWDHCWFIAWPSGHLDRAYGWKLASGKYGTIFQGAFDMNKTQR